MRFDRRLKRALLRRLLPPPVSVRHGEYSMILSADDEPAAPSPRLISSALAATQAAQAMSLKPVCDRMSGPPYYPEVWPGENYKLLAGFVAALQPKRVVEIGTGGGTSTLSMLQGLPSGGTLRTFDVIDWRVYPQTLLRAEDFRDGRLTFSTDDLTQPDVFARHRRAFEEADFLFIDAAKDGVMEQVLLDRFAGVEFKAAPLMVFDDIRVWNMLKIWRGIRHPKLDLTSFGHWTGTGLVDWTSSRA